MSLTSKGKKWELLHLLWIGWTFTLFFNYFAFFYIGFRAPQRKWIIWGTVYLGLFVLFLIVVSVSEPKSWQSDAVGFPWLFAWPVSVFHAFWVRKEYLLRLEASQLHEAAKNSRLKERLAAEYGRKDSISSSVVTATEKDASVSNSDTSTKMSSAGSLSSNRPDLVKKDHTERKQPSTALTAKQVNSLPKVLSGDELEYRISSSFPFPLAFGFRSLASIVDPRDLYREQLRVAENILAFLGSMSIMLLEEEDREKAGVDPRDYWLTGISPGDWKEIVARSSKSFAGYQDNPLATSIKDLNIRSEKKRGSFGANMSTLIRTKNDYKHDRGPQVLEDIAQASVEVQERLRECMEALAFSTAYPIRQVEDFDVDRLGNGVILKCLRYTGDHPSFPQEEVPFPRALPRGDLFLDLGRHGWMPLFPFMTTMTCSHCKARETYFIDAWDARRGTARLKSFERGHTMSSTEVADALSNWSASTKPESL